MITVLLIPIQVAYQPGEICLVSIVLGGKSARRPRDASAGPTVLGDPSTWPGEQACLDETIRTLAGLRDAGTIKPVDLEAAARLFNGAALTAALWVSAAKDPASVLERAAEAFRALAEGLLAER